MSWQTDWLAGAGYHEVIEKVELALVTGLEGGSSHVNGIPDLHRVAKQRCEKIRGK